MKMESEGTCEVKCIHEDSVREVKSKMLSEETFQGIASDFKILGDPTRVKILHDNFRCNIWISIYVGYNSKWRSI